MVNCVFLHSQFFRPFDLKLLLGLWRPFKISIPLTQYPKIHFLFYSPIFFQINPPPNPKSQIPKSSFTVCIVFSQLSFSPSPLSFFNFQAFLPFPSHPFAPALKNLVCCSLPLARYCLCCLLFVSSSFVSLLSLFLLGFPPPLPPSPTRGGASKKKKKTRTKLYIPKLSHTLSPHLS